MSGVFEALALALAASALAWAAGRRGPRAVLLDAAVTGLLAVLVVGTLSGMALMRAGLFSSWSVALAMLLVAAVLWRGRPRAGTRPDRTELGWQALVVAGAATLVLFCVAFRFHEVEGRRDPGIYTGAALELARTGDFGWEEPLVARHGLNAVSHLLWDWKDFHDGKPRWERIPGYAVYEGPPARVVPQFLGGFETWLALAFRVGGAQATQCVNALFAALAVLAFFCAVRRMTGTPAAAFAALLLCVNPAQLWFARFTGNEAMVQALVWGMVFLIVAATEPEPSVRGSDEASGPARRRRFAFWMGMGMLGTAVMIKFATWVLLPPVAFALGFARGRGWLAVSRRALWIALPGIGLAAWLHARVFAHYYLYGSWNFSVAKLGIGFHAVPLLLAGVVLLPAWAGEWVAGHAAWLRRIWERRGWSVAALVVVVLVAFLVQRHFHARMGASHVSIWDERTNLAQFAMYLSPLGFVAGLAGLGLLVAHARPRRVFLFLLLLAGSAFFLWQRRLDAMHPWGARRWLPVLVPAWCAGAGYLVALVWRVRGRRFARPAAAVAVLAVGASMLYAAPQLVLARNYRGLIPSIDRLAAHLRSDDLVLYAHSLELDKCVPYMKGRFDVDMYTQLHTPDQWARSLELARRVNAEGRRVMVLADTPVLRETTGPEFLRLVAEEHLRYEVLWDAAHRLPKASTVMDRPVQVYELLAEDVPPGWSPFMRIKPPPLRVYVLPMTIPLDSRAGGLLDRFHDPSPLPDGGVFRWTDGNGRIALGEALRDVPPGIRLRLLLRVSSRRPGVTVPAGLYLDLGTDRQRELRPATPLGPEFTDLAADIERDWVGDDSVLEIQSLRPAVGDSVATGVLGVGVESIRFEHIE